MPHRAVLLGECNRVLIILEEALALRVAPVEQLRYAQRAIRDRRPPPGAQDPLGLVALRSHIEVLIDQVIANPPPNLHPVLRVRDEIEQLAAGLA